MVTLLVPCCCCRLVERLYWSLTSNPSRRGSATCVPRRSVPLHWHQGAHCRSAGGAQRCQPGKGWPGWLGRNPRALERNWQNWVKGLVPQEHLTNQQNSFCCHVHLLDFVDVGVDAHFQTLGCHDFERHQLVDLSKS